VPPELCKKLEEYFKDAFNLCGWKLFASVFFGEPIYFDDDYTISSWELRRKQLVKAVEQLMQGLQQHLVGKGKTRNQEQLFTWYERLWELLARVTEEEGKLLAFDCEPYEEMR
jgi:hypothetical protein